MAAYLEENIKQETIQKSNEKPTVPTQGQTYSKVTLHTKTFPTIPIMRRLIGGNPVFWGDKGEATKWKIFIYRLIPGQRHKRDCKKQFLKKIENLRFWDSFSKKINVTLKSLLTGDFFIMSHFGTCQRMRVSRLLKYMTYSPEHKTERFRAIKVIVNFWKPVEVGQNGVFWQKQHYVRRQQTFKLV
jgi:hypothetical protein